MVKILAGLIAAVVIAAGGYFGLEFYVQQGVASEVDAAFADLRATGAKATHGKVSFDLWSRTIMVADIAGESTAQPPFRVKIGRFVATGVSQPEAGRFAAERIDASDAEVSGTMAIQGGLNFSYRAPRVEVANYAGPAGPLRRLDAASPVEVYRFALEHFAAITAASVTIPSMTAAMKAATSGNVAGAGDYAYTGLTLRDIRDGKIATMGVDRMTFNLAVDTAGKKETMTGEVEKLAAHDFDAAAVIAMLDPARARDDKVVRVYRQMTSGSYTAAFGTGMRMRIEGVSADDLGVRPAKVRFDSLMAIVDAAPPPGTTATPAQLRDMFEKMAGLYEGAYLGSAEVRGLSIETPEGPFRLAAIRLGKLDNGKLAEFALEGLDARAPQGPVKLGRFALKSLDVANLMRVAAQLSASGGNPTPDQLAALGLLLEGAEVQGLVAPYKGANQPVNLDTLNLSWGQFVGPVPTRARATLKMSGPVDLTDPEPFRSLAGAGIASTSIAFDLGAAWAEGTRAFALEPVTLDVGNVLTAAARLSVANVPREVFSINPLQVVMMAAQIEAGPIELALRDVGGVDLAVAQYARTQNVSRDAARKALIDNIKSTGMTLASANPDAMAIAGALARFVEVPRGTVTIKLSPRGKVPMMALIEALRTNPMAALALFQVDASVGR
jgi:hypothetical protein